MRGLWWSILSLSLLARCGLTAGCAPAADPNTDVLKLGAYSVVKEAFHEGLLPAFAAEWKSKTGREVRFEESYNASGAQARAIVCGLRCRHRGPLAFGRH